MRVSKAAKNYWSVAIEKYKAREDPVTKGIELTNKDTIVRTEIGINFFTELNTNENYSLSRSLQ